jgi:type I restriction enzyme R subunit
MFWGADGKPISTQKFIEEMFGRLPDFFSSSDELHRIWGDPDTRDALLEKLEEAGYGEDVLKDIRKIIDAEECDLLDVLEWVAYNTTPIERRIRAQRIDNYYRDLSEAQKQFVEYIVNAYIKSGVDELRMNKLKTLLSLKFGSVPEGINALGGAPVARQVFKDFQYHLYNGQPVINLEIHNHFEGEIDNLTINGE